MKNFFANIGRSIEKFMIGRYGIDQLWRALIVFILIDILVANALYRVSKVAYIALTVLAFAIMIFGLFRIFSKNIVARQQENAKWLRFVGNIKGWFAFNKTKFNQRKTHKFVKCSKCKSVLRLPRHKGKINVTCPHCQQQFIVNTGKKK